MYRIIILAFFFGCVGIPVSAQEATYDATVSFLKSKLNVQNNKTVQSISFPKRCHLSISDRSRNRSWHGGKFEYVSEVNLADLDPSSIMSTDSVTVFVREYQELVSAKIYNRFNNRLFYSENKNELTQTPRCNSETLVCEGSAVRNNILMGLTLPPDSENFQRVARAMTHLISLCGGKEELF